MKLKAFCSVPSSGRVNEHRKSRSYCRTERLNCTKPVLGSQWSHKLRVRNAVPAPQGAPDGTLPPCGVRTFPPYRRLKCISDGKGKRGRKGWKTVGCPSLAFVLLLRGTLWNQKMPLWGVFPQGCGRLARPSHKRRTGKRGRKGTRVRLKIRRRRAHSR